MAKAPMERTVDNSNQALRDQVFSNMELDENDLDGEGQENIEDEPDTERASRKGKDAERAESGSEEDQGDQVSDEDAFDLDALINASEKEQPKKKGGKQQQQTRPSPGLPGRYEQDQKGNIIDPRTGNVLAKAGAEARLYQAASQHQVNAHRATMERETMRGHLQEAVQFIQQFQNEVRNLRAQMQNTDAHRLGITPSEHSQALELVSALKKGGTDAVNALKTILTRAAAVGIDVGSLGVQGGLDAKAIVDMIKAEISPVTSRLTQQDQERQRAEQQQQQTEQQYRATAEYVVDFFRNNSDAVPYAQTLERMMRHPQYQGYSLRECWLTIQNHLARNGSVNSGQPQSESSHREIPRTRGRQDVGAFDASKPAPVNASYEDIVDELLTASGMTR